MIPQRLYYYTSLLFSLWWLTLFFQRLWSNDICLTAKAWWSTPVENTMLRGTWQFWNTRSGILGSMTLKPWKFPCCFLNQPARNMAEKQEITGITCPSVWVPSAHGRCLPGRGSYELNDDPSDHLLSSTYEMRTPHENPKLLSTKFIQIQRDSQSKTAFVTSLVPFTVKTRRVVPQHLCSRQSFPSPAGLELEV